jgi:hypothetical protein
VPGLDLTLGFGDDRWLGEAKGSRIESLNSIEIKRAGNEFFYSRCHNSLLKVFSDDFFRWFTISASLNDNDPVERLPGPRALARKNNLKMRNYHRRMAN